MPLLSAILITYNEERDLPQALDSLTGVADEIFVVDSGSKDRTCEIASQRGAHVVVRPFTDFADQKNFAASQARHDWVLSLDADERLSPELVASLVAWKQRDPESIGYEIARKRPTIWADGSSTLVGIQNMCCGFTGVTARGLWARCTSR